jgi:hypothetical protein
MVVNAEEQEDNAEQEVPDQGTKKDQPATQSKK